MAYKASAIDIWSMGVTLYFMIYGKIPFYSDNFNQFKKNILDKELTFPTHAEDDLKDLLFGCLRKNQWKRLTIKQILAHPFTTDGGEVELTNIDNRNELYNEEADGKGLARTPLVDTQANLGNTGIGKTAGNSSHYVKTKTARENKGTGESKGNTGKRKEDLSTAEMLNKLSKKG
jgi:serine/threonine protein kinase